MAEKSRHAGSGNRKSYSEYDYFINLVKNIAESIKKGFQEIK